MVARNTTWSCWQQFLSSQFGIISLLSTKPKTKKTLEQQTNKKNELGLVGEGVWDLRKGEKKCRKKEKKRNCQERETETEPESCYWSYLDCVCIGGWERCRMKMSMTQTQTQFYSYVSEREFGFIIYQLISGQRRIVDSSCSFVEFFILFFISLCEHIAF